MFFQFKSVRLESAIQLLIIPLSIATLVGGVYFLLHVDFQSVVIPDWYKEEPFEATPINEFVEYWKGRSIAIGSNIFALTFGFMLVFYIFKNRIEGKLDIKNGYE